MTLSSIMVPVWRASAFLLSTVTVARVATAQSTFDYQSRVGLLLTREEGNHCLTIPKPGLAPGTAVVLAEPEGPSAVIRGVIAGAVAQPCPGDLPGAQDSFYAVRIESQVAPPLGSLWLAFLVEDGVLVTTPAGAAGDLDGDGTMEHLRVCTSNEGLHLTVWSGRPLEGIRRWHRYYYLGYDVEPSCTERDYEGTGGGESSPPP